MQQEQGTTQHQQLGQTQGQRQGKVKFQCKDVVQGCPWEVSGKDEQEIMPKIKEHGRTSHHINSFDHNTENKVKNAIHQQKAA
ncbi:MAG: DUF1059 domain-containing protein [Terriglobales bacterium]